MADYIMNNTAVFILQCTLVAVACAILATSIHILSPWEEGVVLRLGRFRDIRGNGLFLTVPLIESVVHVVDRRTRSASFKAEGTLTRDTVPVTVEAILFYKVVDVKSAVLNVEDYSDSIELAATTALREAISSNDLQTLLTERQKVDDQLTSSIAPKAKDWGIEVGSVEIRDIALPKDLSDAMSRQSQATREKQARETLASAELVVAEQCALAAAVYEKNPVALQLRGMNMIYEGLKEKGAMIIVPSTAVESMNIGSMVGMSKATQQTVQE